MGGLSSSSSRKSEKSDDKKEVKVSDAPADAKPQSAEHVENEIKANLFSEKNLEKAMANAVVDAVFLCDCTGSMGSFIGHAKATIKKMVEQIRAKYIESSIFVGFIGYRDHCDKDILETINLTGDMEEVYKFIDKLNASGGGDEAEAVADALKEAVNTITWREGSLKLVLHILDAPPHGKEFGAGSDDHRSGCPCGVSCQNMMKKLDEMGTQYLILKYHSSTDRMAEIFKQNHKNVRAITLDVPNSGAGAVCDSRAARDASCSGGSEEDDREEEHARKISDAMPSSPLADKEMADKPVTPVLKEEAEEAKKKIKKRKEKAVAEKESEEPVGRVVRSASFCAAENMVEVATSNVMDILESNIGSADKK